MLLDMNDKMVRRVFSLFCVVCFVVCVFTFLLICVLQVSATEECVGPMKLTQEPIQVRDFLTSTVMLLFSSHARSRWQHNSILILWSVQTHLFKCCITVFDQV